MFVCLSHFYSNLLLVLKGNNCNKANEPFKRFETSNQLQQLLHQLPTNHSQPYIDTPNLNLNWSCFVYVWITVLQFQIILDKTK